MELVPVGNEDIVFMREGVPMTTSLLVAEKFDKEHRTVLRNIKNIECSKAFSAHNFVRGSYNDKQGQERPMYYITKDGFMFLVMGLTGKKAAIWKEKFLELFNRLSDFHTSQATIQSNLIETFLPQMFTRAAGRRLQKSVDDLAARVNALTQFKKENNSVSIFANKCLAVAPDGIEFKDILYSEYKAFAGYRQFPVYSKSHFFRLLYSLHPHIKPTTRSASGERLPAVLGIRFIRKEKSRND